MKRTLGSLSIAVLLVMILSGAVFAAILNVPASYPTIQAAIDAAAWGDTVLVAPGNYLGSIKLKSGVNVQSVGGPAVTIIQGNGSWLWYRWITYTVLGADNSSISGFTISGSMYGILTVSHSLTITGNVLTGNSTAGVSNGDHYGYYSGSSSATVKNNTISGSTYGIYNRNAVNSIISDNAIKGNNVGIADISSSPVIANNTATGNGSYNIYNGGNSAPIIKNNLILGATEMMSL